MPGENLKIEFQSTINSSAISSLDLFGKTPIGANNRTRLLKNLNWENPELINFLSDNKMCAIIPANLYAHVFKRLTFTELFRLLDCRNEP